MRLPASFRADGGRPLSLNPLGPTLLLGYYPDDDAGCFVVEGEHALALGGTIEKNWILETIRQALIGDVMHPMEMLSRERTLSAIRI
jgi:hypothetical protein